MKKSSTQSMTGTLSTSGTSSMLGKLSNLGMVFLAVAVLLSVPDSFAQKQLKEILVFAGAGMQSPLDEIGKKFEERYGVKVIYDYEGSGRLGNKILVGQSPDVFIPGSEKWARILKEKGYINDYTPIAYHTPVIITQKGNGSIGSLHDLADLNNRIVLGDAEAAAIGGPSTEILKKAGLDESKMNIKARGITVKQLVLWVEEKNADASIVWRADAVQSGKVKIIEIPEKYNCINMIPVCQMAKGNDNAAAPDKSNVTDNGTGSQWASRYISLVLSDEGKGIFARYGFEAAK
ncbi:MAG: molybdate ABC transporter substrate-binding protein [bacterium]